MDRFFSFLFSLVCWFVLAIVIFAGAVVGVRVGIWLLEKLGAAPKGTGAQYTSWLSKKLGRGQDDAQPEAKATKAAKAE